MTQSWEDHQKLLAELDRQRIEREAREAQERQEADRSPVTGTSAGTRQSARLTSPVIGTSAI
jgi:hypothetical protein